MGEDDISRDPARRKLERSNSSASQKTKHAEDKRDVKRDKSRTRSSRSYRYEPRTAAQQKDKLDKSKSTSDKPPVDRLKDKGQIQGKYKYGLAEKEKIKIPKPQWFRPSMDRLWLEVKHLLKPRASSRKVQKFEDILQKFTEKEKSQLWRKPSLLPQEFEYFRSLYLEAFCTYFFDTDPTATLRTVHSMVPPKPIAPIVIAGNLEKSIPPGKEKLRQEERDQKSKESTFTEKNTTGNKVGNTAKKQSQPPTPSPPDAKLNTKLTKAANPLSHPLKPSPEKVETIKDKDKKKSQFLPSKKKKPVELEIISSSESEDEESSESSSEDDDDEDDEDDEELSSTSESSNAKDSNSGILSQIEKLIETAPAVPEDTSRDGTNSMTTITEKTEPEPEPEKKTEEAPITDQATMRDMSRHRLHQQRKLMLFLDIDHTIVHSTKDSQARRFLKHPKLGISIVELNFSNQYCCPYYVIKRPGLVKFLREVTQKYNIVLYTMGSRAYAECVCKVIDPDSSLIRNRIISREDRYDKNLVDEKDRPIKSIQEFFPLYRSTAMIVDDTSNVWTDPEDVYKVSKFLFWGADSSGDTNEHTSLDWNPNRMGALFNTDRELYRALRDLDEIYNSYFNLLDKGESPSAPELMRAILRKRYTNLKK